VDSRLAFFRTSAQRGGVPLGGLRSGTEFPLAWKSVFLQFIG
jgi:hypothetical protein